MVGRFMDDAVSDEMIEAWFSTHRGMLCELSELAWSDIAPWIPIIGLAANDRSIGLLDDQTSLA